MSVISIASNNDNITVTPSGNNNQINVSVLANSGNFVTATTDTTAVTTLSTDPTIYNIAVLSGSTGILSVVSEPNVINNVVTINQGQQGPPGASGQNGIVTVLNYANNRIITALDIDSEVYAESDLTFDGSTLSVSGASLYVEQDAYIQGTLSAGTLNFGGINSSGNLIIQGSGNFFGGLYVNSVPVSLSGHTHTSSDITNFNSSVSGLLPTINNSGDNRLLTSTGSSLGINAESNLTFNGTFLSITGSGNFSSGLKVNNHNVWHSGNLSNPVIGSGTTLFLPRWSSASGITNSIVYDNGDFVGFGPNGAIISNGWTGGEIGLIAYDQQIIAIQYVDGSFRYGGGYVGEENIIVTPIGNVGIGTDSPSEKLTVNGNGNFNGNVFVGSISGSDPLTISTPTASMIINDYTIFLQSDVKTEANLQLSDSSTADSLLVTDGNKNVVSLISPSLTEISYVSGVTSNIQTQLDGKQATLTNPVTGTGVANHIPYWSSTSGLLADSNQLVWDATNNRLAIGTSSPSYKLDVVGTGNFTGDLIIGGNLTVNGTTVTANVDTMTIEDPIITLGLASGNIVTNDTLDRGLALVRATGLTAFMGWDSSASQFVMLSSGVATNNSGNYDTGTYGDLQIRNLTSSTGNFAELSVNSYIDIISSGSTNANIIRFNDISTPNSPSLGSVSNGTRLLLTSNDNLGHNAIGVDYGGGGNNNTWFSVPSGMNFKFYNGSNSIFYLAESQLSYNGNFTVDSNGNVNSATWNASAIAVNKGGTGRTSYSNGQLLIGSGTGLAANTLTATSGIGITNGSGTITIGVTGIPSSTITNFDTSVDARISLAFSGISEIIDKCDTDYIVIKDTGNNIKQINLSNFIDIIYQIDGGGVIPTGCP